MTLMQPVRNMCMFELEKQPDKTQGGLYVPGTARPVEFKTAKCVAVGPGRYLQDGTLLKPSLEVGQRVMLHVSTGVEVKYKDEKYLFADADEVLVILTDDAPSEFVLGLS